MMLVTTMLCSSIKLTNAEYVMDELVWSAEACTQKGFRTAQQHQFDLCATLEFCQGAGEFGNSDDYDGRRAADEADAAAGEFGEMEMEMEMGHPRQQDTAHKNVVHLRRRATRKLQPTGDGDGDYNNYYNDYGNNYYGEDENGEEGSGSGGNSPRTTPSEGTFGWRVAGETGCSSPGPTMRLRRGVKYGLFLNNTALLASDDDDDDDDIDARTTNLHTHGLHISGSGNADDVTRSVRPGDVAIYNLTLGSTAANSIHANANNHHMGGTFWYHSHHHGVVKQQVSGGAFGMLIVEDGDDDDDGDHNTGVLGTSDPNVLAFLKNEKLLVIDNARQQNDQMTMNGMAFQNNKETATSSSSTTTTTIDLVKNQWYRFRLLHVNVDAHKSGTYVHFESPECEVRPVAHDGIFKFEVPGQTQSKYFLSSSSRLDVAVKCAASSTIRGGGSAIATLNVVDEPQAAAEGGTAAMAMSMAKASPFENEDQPWKSKRPSYLQDLSKEAGVKVDNKWTVDVYETSINDIQYSLERPLCDSRNKDFVYGTVQEWELKGTSGHPFHVHMYPMQVVGDCGDEHQTGEFYDTVVVQTKDYSGSDRKCIVRLYLIDIAGHAMMHCHILQHEDQGAMGFINVVVPPSSPAALLLPSSSSKVEAETTSTSSLLDGRDVVEDSLLGLPADDGILASLPQFQPTTPSMLVCANGLLPSDRNCNPPKEVTYCESKNVEIMANFAAAALLSSSATDMNMEEEYINNSNILDPQVNELGSGVDGIGVPPVPVPVDDQPDKEDAFTSTNNDNGDDNADGDGDGIGDINMEIDPYEEYVNIHTAGEDTNEVADSDADADADADTAVDADEDEDADADEDHTGTVTDENENDADEDHTDTDTDENENENDEDHTESDTDENEDEDDPLDPVLLLVPEQQINVNDGDGDNVENNNDFNDTTGSSSFPSINNENETPVIDIKPESNDFAFQEDKEKMNDSTSTSNTFTPTATNSGNDNGNNIEFDSSSSIENMGSPPTQEQVNAYWNGKEANAANNGLLLLQDISGSGSARASLSRLSLLSNYYYVIAFMTGTMMSVSILFFF
jgi:FtsP/CotA-like multicopper oxidase with cupredoxin domain